MRGLMSIGTQNQPNHMLLLVKTTGRKINHSHGTKGSGVSTMCIGQATKDEGASSNKEYRWQ